MKQIKKQQREENAMEGKEKKNSQNSPLQKKLYYREIMELFA